MVDRNSAISLALADYTDRKLNRTETVEFRGNVLSIPVVTINLETPLLNPNNSRLRAQLANHPQGDVVRNNPKSPEAQLILQNLLSQTEKFEQLKQQLKDFSQQEPGIISRDGLLVNGNTRLAALRSIGASGFDVAVLPTDATDDDFFSIEMSLQLRNLVHQDYTFTNRLLLVESHFKRTQNSEVTIKAMQWKRDGEKRLKEHQGYLNLVEEIRELNPRLSYAFFDSKEELIKNLYVQYQALVGTSPRDAEKLKWTRVQGMLLGLNKDEIREMNEDFIEDEIIPLLDGDDVESYVEKFRITSESNATLDELLGENDSSEFNFKEMAKDIAQTVVDSRGDITDSTIETHFKRLHNQYRGTARRIREERIASDMRAQPVDYLKEVTIRVQTLADQIPTLFQDQHFDKSQFEYQARKTEKAIQALQDALRRKLGS